MGIKLFYIKYLIIEFLCWLAAAVFVGQWSREPRQCGPALEAAAGWAELRAGHRPNINCGTAAHTSPASQDTTNTSAEPDHNNLE